MFNIFLILHAILAIVLVLSVLLQRSDGGALGGLGGGANFSGMLEGRRSADFLTKLTTIIGVLFLANSLFLAILTKNKNDSSVIQSEEIEEIVIPNETKGDKAIIPDTEWVKLLLRFQIWKLKQVGNYWPAYHARPPNGAVAIERELQSCTEEA